MVKAISFLGICFISFYIVFVSFKSNDIDDNVTNTFEQFDYSVQNNQSQEKVELTNKTEKYELKESSEQISEEKYELKESSQQINEEKPIMMIEIPKLKLSGNIYSKKSYLNNIDKNIVVMDDSDYPDKQGGMVIIGAHSGVGRIAFFKRLNLVEVGDLIYIKYNNNTFVYKIIYSYLDSKDGSIVLNNSVDKKSRLYLFTCNPGDKGNYLVVVSEQVN